MSHTRLGLIYCLLFVSLEAFQAVYLGSVFQDTDSFLVGAWVFGISVVVTFLLTAYLRPSELLASIQAIKVVFVLNILAAITWSTYFIAVQLIEPAVVFTVFSGMVPLGTVLASRLGLAEAQSVSGNLVKIGYALILVSIIALGSFTTVGMSGFVRGGISAAILGILLSAVSGCATAFVILYSVRLNSRGVGPLAQFGLRFIMYTILSIFAYLAGIDEKDTAISAIDLSGVVLVGLLVIALPLYLVQKAVPLLSATAIAAITALGPAIVFVLQLAEGRVDYSSATLAGLSVYIVGACLTVTGAFNNSTTKQ